MHEGAPQLTLLGGGQHDPVSEPEATAIGHALLAKLRGEELTFSQRALLARAPEQSEAERRAPTPVQEVSRTLLTLPRGRDAEVRVRWRRFRGSTPFLDLRRFERADRGELLPTRQGVTIRGAEIGQSRRRRDPRQSRVAILFRDEAAPELTLDVLGDPGKRSFQRIVADIVQQHLITRERQHMGYSIAHLAGPDHADLSNFHAPVLLLPRPYAAARRRCKS